MFHQAGHRGGSPPPPRVHFAYPNGRPGIDYNAETMAILRKAGIDMAFTTREEFARPDEPPLERSRFLMLDTLSASEVAHRLAYSWPR